LPKVIIVASPDASHWGKGEFGKFRLGGAGTLLHYPVWSLEELVAARPILFRNLKEGTVKARYRLFGGVPGNILSCPDSLLQAQKTAVTLLTRTQLEQIGRGRVRVLHSYDPTQTGSKLIAYDLPLDKDGKRTERFDDYRVIFVSPAVEKMRPVPVESSCRRRIRD
jgi:hypothetical protein